MSTTEVPSTKHAAQEASAGSLEARFAALEASVAKLAARVAMLEAAAHVSSNPRDSLAPDAPMPVVDLPNPVQIIGLIGRVCLILGGATFIRALVDAGTVHRGWGVAMGLAYAISWVLLANRSKRPLDATFYALASILIAYPLLAESTVRFGILPPALAAVLLLSVTGLHGAVAWRRGLVPMVWMATLAALGSGLVMMAGRHAIEPFLTVFLLLGAGALWLTEGRPWEELRWPTALVADLGTLIFTSLAIWPGGPPEAYRGISCGWAMAFALILVVLYLGSFAVRMLLQRREASTFEIVQSSLAVLLGFGGALRVALAMGSGAGLVGTGIILAGAGFYVAAIPFATNREETRRNFQFCTFLALALLLSGGAFMARPPLFTALSGLVGLGVMAAGLRLGRIVLILQSGIYLLAASVVSGMVTWSARAVLDPSSQVNPPSAAGFISLLLLGAALALFLIRRPSDGMTARLRPAVLILGALAAAGVGGLMICGCHSLLRTGTDTGALAAIRTGVLSVLAIALAWSGRRVPILELRWLVYPLLIITALKFMFEDLAVGRPLTLFLGFMCYGATLMLAPRLLKVSAPQGAAGKPESSTQEVDS